MSRTGRIIGATSISYLHQAVLILVGLWLTPFLLRRVGQHTLGLWLVAGQLLGYLALMDLGVIAILPREVAFASSSPESTAPGGLIGSLVWQVRRIVRWQMLGLSAVCALLWWWLPSAWSGLQWPIAIVFVAFVGLYPLRIVTAVLQGMQELPFLSKTQLFGWACGTATTLGLVLAGHGLYGLVVGWAVGIAVPAVAAWWRVHKRWPGVLAKGGARPVSHYFRRSLWVSVSQIAQVLLNGSDVLLLGRMLGAAAVVPYACTGKLVTVFTNHPQVLMHAAQPALSELRASESQERLAYVATALTQAMLMMSGALVVVIMPINQFFVGWWVGPGQYGGWWLTVALTCMMLLRHWNVATIYTLFCFGYERQISLTGLFDGIVTAVGTAVLVWKWGPVGAPLASILGVATVSLPLNLISVARELRLSTPAFLMGISPLLGRILGIAGAAAAASVWVGGGAFVPTALLTASVALLYTAAVFPLAWNGPVGPYLRTALPFTVALTGEGSLAAKLGGIVDRWFRPVTQR